VEEEKVGGTGAHSELMKRCMKEWHSVPGTRGTILCFECAMGYHSLRVYCRSRFQTQISSLKLSWEVWGQTHSDDFLKLKAQIHVDASGSSFAILFLWIDSENTSEAHYMPKM
jgi:hypothetical protein